MATTFTWEVTGIKRVLADGGVLQASFTVKGRDSKDGKEFEVGKNFSTVFDKYDASSSDFIQYKDLKSEKVFEWIYALNNKDSIEKSIEENLKEQMTPATLTESPPWVEETKEEEEVKEDE